MNLLRELIREAVIDAADRFRAKRSADLTDRVTALSADMPGVFARQERLERMINNALESLKSIPDQFISQKRMRFAVPDAFDPDEGWGPNGSVFDVVSFTGRHESCYERLKRFVQSGSTAFRKACDALLSSLNALQKSADEHEWPAPWRRYTSYALVSSDVCRFVSNVEEMLRDT